MQIVKSLGTKLFFFFPTYLFSFDRIFVLHNVFIYISDRFVCMSKSVPVFVSALGPGAGVVVYAGLVGALLLCVILVLCVGILVYRRSCRHFHGEITDSSSALTAAFHPGNYKPPRQGETSVFPHFLFLTHFF